MTPAIQVENVSRRFGATAAVDNVSLSVAPGEFLSLLGPSGCGKTTLLRLIGGFELPDSGRVRLYGDDVTEQPPNRRRTNMVFQHLALFPHMSVHDNIAFSLSLQSHDAADIRRRVSDVLSLVRLRGFESRRIDQLSGGQKQRVAIGRAIINNPAALLLDEPLGALDLKLRLELQTELKRLQRELGSPFVFVTHDQGEAMAMSDRIALMDQGRIIQVGTPREIYTDPQSLFVAQFVGMTNLISGRVAAARGNEVEVYNGHFHVTGKAQDAMAVSDAAVAAIRYESVQVTPERDDAAIKGVVTDISFLGSTCRVAAKVDDVCEIICEASEESMRWLTRGARVSISWEEKNVKVFKVVTM